MRRGFQIALMALPWRMRRWALRRSGWVIGPDARIGYSLIGAERVELGPGARIGHATLVKGLNQLVLGEQAILGSLNWITAFPRHDRTFFGHIADRDPSLVIGDHAAVTTRHLIDCTGGVSVGAFTTIGGWGSQVLTHSIDVRTSRQDAAPVTIGSYCFVGTRVVLLKGSALANRCVLSAGSVLAHAHREPDGLYGGNPAQRLRDLPDGAYFTRSIGFVH